MTPRPILVFGQPADVRVALRDAGCAQLVIWEDGMSEPPLHVLCTDRSKSLSAAVAARRFGIPYSPPSAVMRVTHRCVLLCQLEGAGIDCKPWMLARTPSDIIRFADEYGYPVTVSVPYGNATCYLVPSSSSFA